MWLQSDSELEPLAFVRPRDNGPLLILRRPPESTPTYIEVVALRYGMHAHPNRATRRTNRKPMPRTPQPARNHARTRTRPRIPTLPDPAINARNIQLVDALHLAQTASRTPRAPKDIQRLLDDEEDAAPRRDEPALAESLGGGRRACRGGGSL
ncbi:hypothetical protein HBI64_004980 [Parastagonospora nodorum]|nr:hypothetical protein HBI64_004980 [Parastagonospora nodorum]